MSLLPLLSLRTTDFIRVGSGKSTLMQALLGETITHNGFLSVALNDSIAFCAQTPWLVNKSFQQNILGTSVFDGPWYAEVLKACALLEDLRNYPAGDRTLVGSKGITLSGGQKQRIVSSNCSIQIASHSLIHIKALARAVYARKPIVILDDVFSGLDPITENIIFQSLFGSDGIFRRGSQTVILATHAIHLLSKADMVILLGNDSDIIYQGSYASFPSELAPRADLHSSSDFSYSDKATMIEKIEAFDSEEFIPRFHPSATELDIVAPNNSRQMGDSAVYKYYLKTMGVKHVVLFVVLGAVCMGFTPAQSTYHTPMPLEIDRINGPPSSLVECVVR